MLLKRLIPFILTILLVQGSDLGTKKSQELRARVLSHPGIPKLSASEYQYFIEEAPRPYDVVIFFTATHCTLCDEIEAELAVAANLYKKAGAIYPENSEDKKHRAVYFVKMTFDDATKEIFVGFQFRSVPNILISTPGILRLKRSEEKKEYFKNYLWQISMSHGAVTSQEFLKFINDKTERNVEYEEPILHLLIVWGGLIGASLLVFWVFGSLLQSKKLWFVVSMIVYLICISGIGIDGNFELLRLIRGSRSAFEGSMMSGAISLLGILFITLLHLPNIAGNTMGKVLYSVIFVSIVVLLRWIEDFYQWKSDSLANEPWYYT